MLTKEFFDHLLERIREIRLSGRRFYQKITDIYVLRWTTIPRPKPQLKMLIEQMKKEIAEAKKKAAEGR